MNKEIIDIIEEFKPIKKEQIGEPKFISVMPYKVTLNNGNVVRREKVLKGKKDGSAAIIIPYIGDKIMVVIEPRVFTKIGVGIGFPAGYIEEDEEPKVAALRELREETGLVPERIEEIDSFYQDEGCSAAYNHIFIAYNCKKVYEQKLDKDEFVRYVELTKEEIFKLEEEGYIAGCNAKIAIQKGLKKVL